MRKTILSRIARSAIALWAVSFLWTSNLSNAAAIGVTAVGPFAGEHQESFNEFFLSSAPQYPVFDDLGVLRSDNGSSGIDITTQSTLGSDTVDARSFKMAGQFGIADWDFTQPVAQFGGYWENNSFTDDALVEFFDAGNHSLGTAVASVPTAGQEWVWNGWNFDTPVSRIRVTGNGFGHGFIWYDDMEMTTATPEPGAAVIGGLVGLQMLRPRQIRRSH